PTYHAGASAHAPTFCVIRKRARWASPFPSTIPCSGRRGSRPRPRSSPTHPRRGRARRRSRAPIRRRSWPRRRGRRARRTLRRADVVVENFRPGVMDRLGIGWDHLARLNARLVHVSITGYGSSGPLAALPGFDPIFQARSGFAAAQGGDDAPVLHMIAYNDYCAGALGALATVAALVARERTGRGQHVDVSLFRTAFAAPAAQMILFEGRPPDAVGGRDYLGPAASRRLYACRDGWICVAAPS